MKKEHRFFASFLPLHRLVYVPQPVSSARNVKEQPAATAVALLVRGNVMMLAADAIKTKEALDSDFEQIMSYDY